jgi:RNase adaptor protein for sRNA GlmZ degradation
VIVSFGHKHGLPSRADKVFDVSDLTHDLQSPAFLSKFQEIAEYGKQHPSAAIAIGCKEGKHRSVALANKVASTLRVGVYHRDKGIR